MDELRALVSGLPPELARRAFTHSSWTEDRAESYERLEFLGDGVLGLAVAEELCRRFPDAEEGRLAKLRAHVVSRRSCAVVARVLDLGADLERERERRQIESAGLGTNRNVLAALLEAVVGAAFVAHGYERTAAAVVDAFRDRISYASETYVDHKTELQEQGARRGRSVSYALMDSEGPPHRRRFTTVALVDGVALGTGSGPSKKMSEQAAAREALARLKEEA
ncbi:MAG: ribonuclease [Gaiellales bacterium]|jgi:ribonuclease-3|nr:ribonuclease [Gaiellales bacterium]